MSPKHAHRPSRRTPSPRPAGRLSGYAGLLLTLTVVLALVSTLAAVGAGPVSRSLEFMGVNAANARTLDSMSAQKAAGKRAQAGDCSVPGRKSHPKCTTETPTGAATSTAGSTAKTPSTSPSSPSAAASSPAADSSTTGSTPSPPQNPAPRPGGNATHTEAFIDTIGVATHLGYGDYIRNWDTGAGLHKRLTESGIRHIRDVYYNRTTNPPWQAASNSAHHVRMRTLSAEGIKMLLGDGTATFGGPAVGDYSPAGLAKVRADNGPGLIGFELWNEPSDAAASAVRSQARTIRSSIDSTPALSDLVVVGFSPVIVGNAAANQARVNTFVGGAWNADRSTWAFDPGQYVDYGNWHPYQGGLSPESNPLHTSDATDDGHLMARMFGARWGGADYGHGRGMMATETGYNDSVTAPGSNRPVSELADAKYAGRMFAEFFRLGYARTYKYELFDEPSKSSEMERSFGLIRSDGTVKPSYTTIKNMTTLLADRGAPYTPPSLSYTLGAGDGTIHKVLMGKRDGSHWLAVWQDKSVWDRTNRTDLSPADQSVTLTVPPGKTVTRYVPRTGTTGTPLTVANGSTRVSVPAELTLLKIA